MWAIVETLLTPERNKSRYKRCSPLMTFSLVKKTKNKKNDILPSALFVVFGFSHANLALS
jgi:hypothetical protein